MAILSREDVEREIDIFLFTQLSAKKEPEEKRLAKASSTQEAGTIEKVIEDLTLKYTKEIWMKDAANRMASQLKFGTHIAKGVHPDAKGDNVNFRNDGSLPSGVVGTQLLNSSELDANGNAAALPLAAFFNIDCGGKKLQQLIQSEHPAIAGVFAKERTISDYFSGKFKVALDNKTENPTAHELNKQLLWPLDKAIDHDNYTCLLPLYPSVFTHAIFHKVNDARYSEKNKEARANRKKTRFPQSSYISITDLATTILGGTKPRNVSLLSSKQGGRNILLPSLPPIYSQGKDFPIGKRRLSIFDNSLRYHCRFSFEELFTAIEAPKSTVAVRTQRKNSLRMILAQILSMAASIQRQQSAGWSEGYQLDTAQKYWLDPERALLDGQETFRDQRDQSNWLESIQEQFSRWINSYLRAKYPNNAQQFDDTEFAEWKREFETSIKASQRAKQGIF